MMDFYETTTTTPAVQITHFTSSASLPWLKVTEDIKEDEKIFNYY